jgi:cell division protein FtsB
MNKIRLILKNIIIKYQISKKIFISYIVIIALIGYFLINAIIGNKGIITLNNLANQIASKDSKLKDLSLKVENKQLMIKSISLESLDPDLLDEQSRRVLGYVGRNEIVIYE